VQRDALVVISRPLEIRARKADLVARHYARRARVAAVRRGFNLFIVPRSHVCLLPRTARKTNAQNSIPAQMLAPPRSDHVGLWHNAIRKPKII
jgi:hypothetical protein